MISLSKFRKMKLEGMEVFKSYRCSSIYKQRMPLRHIFREKKKKKNRNNNTHLDFKTTTARLAAKKYFSAFNIISLIL